VGAGTQVKHLLVSTNSGTSQTSRVNNSHLPSNLGKPQYVDFGERLSSAIAKIRENINRLQLLLEYEGRMYK
jgi:hypothetical protein